MKTEMENPVERGEGPSPPASRTVVRCLLALLALLSGMTAAAADVETPPTLQASEVLPSEVLSGPHFKVEAAVENDGVMNRYRVTSDYGPFEAYGDYALVRLIREIAAMAELDETSKAEEFLKQAGRSATGQIKSIKSFAQHPVDTVQGIPGGAKHVFKRFKKQAKQGYEVAKDAAGEVGDAVTPGDDEEEKEGEEGAEGDEASFTEQATAAGEAYAKKWFGVSGAERGWYQKLGVDPYTRNEVLRKMVKAMAKVDAAAIVGMKFVPIPSIPGVNYIDKVTRAVWERSPEELRQANIERLQQAGVDPQLIQSFMDNPYFSPSQQTLLLSTLDGMKGKVEGLSVVLEIAAGAQSVEESDFHVVNTLFLDAYHRTEGALVEVLPGAPVPVAATAAGGLLIIVGADYAFWDVDLSAAIPAMAAEFAEREEASREIWVRGRASDRLVAELAGLGWTPRQQVPLGEAVRQRLLPEPADEKEEQTQGR